MTTPTAIGKASSNKGTQEVKIGVGAGEGGEPVADPKPTMSVFLKGVGTGGGAPYGVVGSKSAEIVVSAPDGLRHGHLAGARGGRSQRGRGQCRGRGPGGRPGHRQGPRRRQRRRCRRGQARSLRQRDLLQDAHQDRRRGGPAGDVSRLARASPGRRWFVSPSSPEAPVREGETAVGATVVLALVLALLAVACDDSNDGGVDRDPSTTTGPSTDRSDHRRDPLPHQGRASRARDPSRAQGHPHRGETVKALVAGPTAQESAAGLGTAIPAGTRFVDLNIADGVARVDLSRELRVGRGQPLAHPAPGPGDVHPRPVRHRRRRQVPARRDARRRLLGQRHRPRPARGLRRLPRAPAGPVRGPVRRHLAVLVEGRGGRLRGQAATPPSPTRWRRPPPSPSATWGSPSPVTFGPATAARRPARRSRSGSGR